MRKLIIYPNCSKGGVSSVIRGRAADEPNTQFDVVFFNDRGGLRTFSDISNVDVRIIREDRSIAYLTYLVSRMDYDSVHVLSTPKIANALVENPDVVAVYEFHSSNMTVVEQELKELDIDKMSQVAVPSEMMKLKIGERLPRRTLSRLIVVPNLVDHHVFSQNGPSDFFDRDPKFTEQSLRPIVWVGRFDKDKGYQYAVRALAQLPEDFIGIFVVSLEHDPVRTSRFLSECDAMGVRDRVQLYMNLSQPEIANLYRSARDRGGVYVSTSLMESFGYAIAESMECGLPCCAFDLPILSLHHERGQLCAAPVGDVKALAESVARIAEGSMTGL
ncbi:glycosyltransferase family 4 protein [Corynebacterium aurimucosum]|nr:glycosyltransferase family 4 protein [Corynebacterium aurimucosum]